VQDTEDDQEYNNSGFSRHRPSAALDERHVAYESGDGLFESQGSLDSRSKRAFAVSFAGVFAFLFPSQFVFADVRTAVAQEDVGEQPLGNPAPRLSRDGIASLDSTEFTGAQVMAFLQRLQDTEEENQELVRQLQHVMSGGGRVSCNCPRPTPTPRSVWAQTEPHEGSGKLLLSGLKSVSFWKKSARACPKE
jgi:hypothetical protein